MNGAGGRRPVLFLSMAALAFVLAGFPACAGGASDAAAAPSRGEAGALREGGRVNLTGLVKAKGNEPFSFAALETEGGVFRLSGPKADELYRGHRLERVRVRGIVVSVGAPPIVPAEIEVLRYRSAN